MQLSTQLFDRIAGISHQGTGKTTVLPVGCRRMPERRAANRIAYGHRTQICRDSGRKAGVWDTVMLQDISCSGVGCICEEPMSIGQTFVLRLLDKDGQTIRIRCKVTRCERGGFGQSAFAVGAAFEQVIHHMIRLNEDEPGGEVTVEPPPQETPATAEPTRLKTAGAAMARAAVGLLRSVDPIRAASHWMHKDDDFSSAG